MGHSSKDEGSVKPREYWLRYKVGHVLPDVHLTEKDAMYYKRQADLHHGIEMEVVHVREVKRKKK